MTAASDELGARLRPLLRKAGVEEKKMFGGIGFMVAGRLAATANAQAPCWCAAVPPGPRNCWTDPALR